MKLPTLFRYEEEIVQDWEFSVITFFGFFGIFRVSRSCFKDEIIELMQFPLSLQPFRVRIILH